MTYSNDFNAAISGKKATPITPSARTGRSKYSVTIVCSKRNGKRVTFTSALATRLKLIDTVFVTAYANDGFIVLGATPFNESSSAFSLSGDDMKIAYSSALVHFLIETFHLEYGGHVSKSFGDISFNDDPDAPMAMLKFPTPSISIESEVATDDTDINGDT